MQTDTPKTDEAALTQSVFGRSVTADFARDLERENARMREVLRFYADPRKYQGPNKNADPDEEEVGGYRIDVTRDGGAKARDILQNVKGTTRSEANCGELTERLAKLCKEIDKEKWLLDVQCQQNDDLVSEWRKTYQSFLSNVKGHTK